jgi:hypothetical protein
MPLTAYLADDTLGLDGRRLIEVTSLVDCGKNVVLEGTACLPEGTVLITVQTRADRAEHFTTASAGGPERGTWRFDVDLPTRPARIELGAENSGEGNVLRSAMAVVAFD